MFPRFTNFIQGIFKIGSTTDNKKTSFETDSDGNLIVTTETDKTVFLEKPVFVDIDFPIIIRTIGAGIPSLTALSGRLTMPQWGVNDNNMCESQELIHSWVEGSQVYWHLHLTTNGLDTTDRYVRFELEFGYCNINGQWVFPSVVDTGDILIPANTPDKTQLILSLHNLELTGIKIGGHCVAYLKRIASTGAAPSNNPWIPMLQMHVLCNSLGSRLIGTK